MNIRWRPVIDSEESIWKPLLEMLLQNQSVDDLPAQDRGLVKLYPGTPPEEIHFKCGSCARGYRPLKRADLFSYTPYKGTHVLEGRCFECTRLFKGQVLKYELGRMVLWARFNQKNLHRVMDS